MLSQIPTAFIKMSVKPVHKRYTTPELQSQPVDLITCQHPTVKPVAQPSTCHARLSLLAPARLHARWARAWACRQLRQTKRGRQARGDLDEMDAVDEHRAWGKVLPTLHVSVAQVRRQRQFPFVAFSHHQ
jgi:hypothetical protein